MEENKNNVTQTEQNGGGRRRRHRRHKNRNRQTAQSTENTGNGVQAEKNAQTEQNAQNTGKKKDKKPANKGSQPVQNNQNNQNTQNKKQKKQNNQNNQNTQNNQNNQGGQRKDENRKDTYVYTLDGNLYINLTNKCSNGCDFCVRNERESYYGNYLWLRHGDPTVEKVVAAVNGFNDLSRFKEAVFCGFGEPTYKVAEMVALCDFFHEKGLKTRLNTNGQGNLINKRDIVPELKGKIDFVNISLNFSCAEKYQPVCRSQFGENGFAALVEFGRLCKRNEIACRFSIVDCIGEDEVEACKRLAESVKIPLYVRKYIQDS